MSRFGTYPPSLPPIQPVGCLWAYSYSTAFHLTVKCWSSFLSLAGSFRLTLVLHLAGEVLTNLAGWWPLVKSLPLLNSPC